MEEIILQLLSDDNVIQQQGFLKLTESYKNPGSTADLFEILYSSSNSKIIQHSAVLLKQRLVNAKQWFHIPQANRTRYKAAVLKLAGEQVSLRSSLVDLINVIAHHELTNSFNGWSELFESTQRLLDAKNSSDQKLGITLLPVIAANGSKILEHNGEWIVRFLKKTLQGLDGLDNTDLYNIQLTTMCLAPAVTDDLQINDEFHKILSQVVCSIKALTEFDNDQSSKILDQLNRLCKNAPQLISSHITILVTTCIAVAENKLFNIPPRVKALQTIKTLIIARSTTIYNNKLLIPILDMTYSVMIEPVDKEFGDFYLKALTNSNTPVTCAMQILYVLSEHFATPEFTAEMLQRTEVVLEDPDIFIKRGCFLGFAVILEHCSEFINRDCLKYVRPDYHNPQPIIKNVAQFAIARMTGDLHLEDIDKDELLPVFFEYLDKSLIEIKQGKDVSTIDILFNILDQVNLNFGRKMLPYLSKMLDYLFEILESDASNHLKILALNAFRTVPDGTFDIIQTYYPKLIRIMKETFVIKQLTKENTKLHAGVFAVMGAIGWSLSKEHKSPVAEYFSNLGVRIIKTSHDPILKAAVYRYFSRTSEDVPTPIVKALPQIFDHIVESVQIVEGTEIHYPRLLVYDETLVPASPVLASTFTHNELDVNYVFDIEDDDDKFHSSYLVEKIAAIESLGELCDELQAQFLPYLERSCQEVLKTVTYPEITVRQASLEALANVFQASAKLELTESSRRILISSSEMLIPFLLKVIYETYDILCMVSAAGTYAKVLKFLKSESLILEKFKESTAHCITDILSGSIRSQKLTEVLTYEVDNSKRQGGSMLHYYFRSVINPEYLLVLFEQLLPLLLQYMVIRKFNAYNHHYNLPIKMDQDHKLMKCGSKYNGIRFIASCFRGLGHEVSRFAPKLVPIFLPLLADLDHRSAACDAIAEITRYGGSAMIPYYPEIQTSLLSALQCETGDCYKNDLMNVIGSLIWTNYSALHIDEVFPIFVMHLPLSNLVPRYRAVFGGILTLMRDHHPVLNNHIKPLMKIVVTILHTDDPDDPNRCLEFEQVSAFAIEFLRRVRQDYRDDWDGMQAFLLPDEVGFVEKLNLAEL